jgi:hypothetical protein
MQSSQEDGHSFVVRFWPEHRENRNASRLWRGMVRHVPSGRHLYSENLEEIAVFIRAYLLQEEPDEPLSTSGKGSPDGAVPDDIQDPTTQKIECTPSGRRGR